ncbi:hypothetical protein L218DRAFT_747261 [Marasmius fiardii PR-910]|nr:hypothetical protein L218DRAFT_747261 [Marasmius fiardii PR-910]
MFVREAEELFNPSAQDVRIRDSLFDAMSYLSMISCIVIILISVLLSLHPLSKPKTDRVSFRIMVYALCGSFVYGIATLIKYRVKGQTACRFAGSFVVFGLHLSSFLFFCIGLNLQLVMIHKVDGARAEKFYVWGSLSLATVLSVLTYLSEQLQYDPTLSVCSYYDPNPVSGLWWRMGMQYLWSFLVMAGEIVTFSSVIIYMVRVKVFESGPGGREATVQRSHALSASHQYRKPLGPKQYRNVVLRIVLYPLSSLVTSGIMTIAATSQSPSQGMTTRSDWIAMIALRTIYMYRGTVYASVAAADPAITQGLKVLYRHYVRRRSSSSPSNEIAVARSAAMHDPEVGRLEAQEAGIGFGNEGGERRTSSYESRTGVVLPSIPTLAVIPVHRDVQHVGTSLACAFSDARTESLDDDGVQFSHYAAELRQL